MNNTFDPDANFPSLMQVNNPSSAFDVYAGSNTRPELRAILAMNSVSFGPILA
jgi:hypothetical protein